LAALYDLDKSKNHVVRLAGARAYRTPLPAVRNSYYSDLTVPLVVMPNSELENEQTWSIEGGYVGQFDGDIMTRVDTYYQRYENLIGHRAMALGAQPKNIDGATGYGGEIEVGWTPMIEYISQRAKWTAWYGLNYLGTDQLNQELRAYMPSRHKVGSTVHLPLLKNFAINLNYAYNNTSIDPNVNLPAPQYVGIHHQCDITASYAIPSWHGEIMIGVWDVFHQADEPVRVTGTYLPHETPGRTFFIRGEFGF
jgi:outer membrane receptor protein involved in Fe transport